MSLYLDTNVLLPLAVVEPRSVLIRDWLAARDEDLVIGRLAVAETGSAVSRLRRMNELDDHGAALALATIDEWVAAATTIVDHEPDDLIQAAAFVRKPYPKLLAPDAIHLATCLRTGHRLVTYDNDLGASADLAGVEWLAPR